MCVCWVPLGCLSLHPCPVAACVMLFIGFWLFNLGYYICFFFLVFFVLGKEDKITCDKRVEIDLSHVRKIIGKFFDSITWACLLLGVRVMERHLKQLKKWLWTILKTFNRWNIFDLVDLAQKRRFHLQKMTFQRKSLIFNDWCLFWLEKNIQNTHLL